MNTATAPNIIATGPVISGPADFSPYQVERAARAVAAELRLGNCFFCRRPLLSNYVRFPIVQSRRPYYTARAHRSCYAQHLEQH